MGRDRGAGGFRLLTEPASLKPRVFNSVSTRLNDSFPAPHRAGLIEAAPPGSKPAAGIQFPAPHRAGLIEASATRACRGKWGGFPAPHRAGLIEASEPPPAAPGRARSGFPAPHRAGLIEAWPPALPALPAARFRLLTEPASLKPGDGGPRDGAGDGFPAPHRAGLIEAPERSRTGPHRRQVSGSSQSRPH